MLPSKPKGTDLGKLNSTIRNVHPSSKVNKGELHFTVKRKMLVNFEQTPSLVICK